MTKKASLAFLLCLPSASSFVAISTFRSFGVVSRPTTFVFAEEHESSIQEVLVNPPSSSLSSLTADNHNNVLAADPSTSDDHKDVLVAEPLTDSKSAIISSHDHKNSHSEETVSESDKGHSSALTDTKESVDNVPQELSENVSSEATAIKDPRTDKHPMANKGHNSESKEETKETSHVSHDMQEDSLLVDTMESKHTSTDDKGHTFQDDVSSHQFSLDSNKVILDSTSPLKEDETTDMTSIDPAPQAIHGDEHSKGKLHKEDQPATVAQGKESSSESPTPHDEPKILVDSIKPSEEEPKVELAKDYFHSEPKQLPDTAKTVPHQPKNSLAQESSKDETKQIADRTKSIEDHPQGDITKESFRDEPRLVAEKMKPAEDQPKGEITKPSTRDEQKLLAEKTKTAEEHPSLESAKVNVEQAPVKVEDPSSATSASHDEPMILANKVRSQEAHSKADLTEESENKLLAKDNGSHHETKILGEKPSQEMTKDTGVDSNDPKILIRERDLSTDGITAHNEPVLLTDKVASTTKLPKTDYVVDSIPDIRVESSFNSFPEALSHHTDKTLSESGQEAVQSILKAGSSVLDFGGKLMQKVVEDGGAILHKAMEQGVSIWNDLAQ